MRKEEKVRITPEMAAQWLGNTTEQRHLDVQRAERIARDITNGAWVYQPGVWIKLSTTMSISDGQHRLKACVLAKKSILSDVQYNIPLTVQWTGGGAKPWGLSDLCKIEGRKNYRSLSTILRGLWKFVFAFPTSSDTPTLHEARIIIDSFPGLERAAERVDALRNKTKSVTGACGVLVYLFHFVDDACAEKFWGYVENGDGMEKHDPILTVREFLSRRQDGAAKVSDNRRLALWIKAWNAYRNGEKMKLARWSADEGFPAIDGLDLESLRKMTRKTS